MALPSLDAYQSAIQHPQYSLLDPVLRAGKVETDQNGSPFPRSGGFAVTFKLQGTNGDWAVRCFHKRMPTDLELRYKAVSQYLAGKNLPGIVTFEYQTHGMLVTGAKVPIVKMKWISGLPMDIYVRQHLNNIQEIRQLSAWLSQITSSLEVQGVAHGDLQNGNILVSDAGLTLVDYDGMFVPALAGQTANEIGHVNFQSPVRDPSQFHSKLDRFSAIVIKLSLEALSYDPSLWGRFNDGENLLFTRKDFVEPETSALVAELKTLPAFGHRINQFILLCRTPLDQLPTLEQFWTGQSHITTLQANVHLDLSRVQMHQYSVIAALDRAAVTSKVGDVVQVVGEVVEVTQKWPNSKRTYLFVNFTDWRLEQFRLILWSEQLDQLTATGLRPDYFRHKWVSVTGLMQLWDGRIPQIIVENVNQIQILKGGTADAQMLLRESSGARGPTLPQQLNQASRNQQIARQMAQKTETVSLPPSSHVESAPPISGTPLSKLSRAEVPRTSNQQIARQLAKEMKPSQPFPPTQASPQSQVPPVHPANQPPVASPVSEKPWWQAHWRAILVISVLLIVLWLLQ